MTALRVGLIVDDGPQPFLVRDLIERSRTSPHYSVVLLVVQDSSVRATSVPLRRRLEQACFGLLSRIEHLLLVRMTGFRDHFRTWSLDSLRVPVLRVRPVREQSGDTVEARYGPDEVAQVSDQHLDLLVVGSTAVPRGAVLNACRLGVIRLRYHGKTDVQHPAGFSEVYHRQPATGFTIERLTEEAPNGVVLFRGAIDTAPLYLLNAARLLRKSVALLHHFIESLAQGARPTVAEPESAEPAPLPQRVPDLKHQIRYMDRTLRHTLERAFRRSRGFRWRWGVAYQFTSDWQAADLSQLQVVRNPPHRYFADPFVVTWQGRSVCFVEDYDCRTSRARITALELERSGYRELGVALEEPFHLSYPFIFEVAGELYMCPETGEARDIRLYRCVEFPLRWELHQVLMRNVAAVDTSIVPHDGRWWMLTNIDTAEMEEYRSELHVFHAPVFDAVEWQPHAANPVIVDSARARNGGVLHSAGRLYRVFQVHDFDVYGRSMGVARISELTPARYEEETVLRIEPTFLPRIVGTHTMSFSGGVLAVDYVRRERCDS